MIFRKLVFPVAFSDRCRGAAPYVRAFANRFASEVELLHVIEAQYAVVGAPELAMLPDSETTDELLRQATGKLLDFRGDYFGDVAMIDHGDRTASIEAESDLKCYTLTFWDFRPLVESDARIAWPLLQAMAKRLRAAEAAS